MIRKLIVSLFCVAAFNAQATTINIDVAADGFSAVFSADTATINCMPGATFTTACAAPGGVSFNQGVTVSGLTFDGSLVDTTVTVWESPTDPAYNVYADLSVNQYFEVGDEQFSLEYPPWYFARSDYFRFIYADINNTLADSIDGVRSIWVTFIRTTADSDNSDAGNTLPANVEPFASSDAVAAINTLAGMGSLDTFDIQVKVIREDNTDYDLDNVVATFVGVTPVPVPPTLLLLLTGLLAVSLMQAGRLARRD